MTLDKALYSRIEAFDIDGGPAAFPFAARLAKENGWSRAKAERAIAEYKRFIYLTATHTRQVCPSEDVDAVWHLHLTYSRSYWEGLCRGVLGREIHHDPTRGGAAEDDKHVRMYEDTLKAYEAAFGAKPPSDIWPSVERRFPAMAAAQRDGGLGGPAGTRPLDFLQRPAGAMLGLLGLGLVTLMVLGVASPFDLVGAQFLGFLIPLMIAAAVLGRRVYKAEISRPAKPADSRIALDWQEAAYLSGGAARLSTAAVARLVEMGAAAVSPGGKVLEATGAKPAGLAPVEREIMGRLPIKSTGGSTDQPFALLTVHAKSAFADRIRKLEGRGLLISPEAAKRAWRLGMAPFALVLVLFALPRLYAGLAAGRPVGFLAFTMFFGGIAGLIIVSTAKRSDRTPKAEAALAGMRERNALLRDALPSGRERAADVVPAAAGSGLVTTPLMAGLAVGLFGTAALAGSDMRALADLEEFLPRKTDDRNTGCGGGGCSSGGSGGGDGGGGCGGGGCGGGCGGG